TRRAPVVEVRRPQLVAPLIVGAHLEEKLRSEAPGERDFNRVVVETATWIVRVFRSRLVRKRVGYIDQVICGPGDGRRLRHGQLSQPGGHDWREVERNVVALHLPHVR